MLEDDLLVNPWFEIGGFEIMKKLTYGSLSALWSDTLIDGKT